MNWFNIFKKFYFNDIHILLLHGVSPNLFASLGVS